MLNERDATIIDLGFFFQGIPLASIAIATFNDLTFLRGVRCLCSV